MCLFVVFCPITRDYFRKRGLGSPSFPLYVDEGQYHVKQNMTSAQDNLKGEN